MSSTHWINVADVVRGQGDGLGRALLTVGHQAADHRQPADDRGVEQPEVAVGRDHEPWTHPIDERLGRQLDQPFHQRLDGDLAADPLFVQVVDRLSGKEFEPDFKVRKHRAASTSYWPWSSQLRTDASAFSSSLRNVASRCRPLDSGCCS